jgi:hypothetical protein
VTPKETIMQWFFSVTGLVCLLVAAGLSMPRSETIYYPGPQPPAAGTTTRVAKELVASWAAAEGFAVAGGLCFIAAALVVGMTSPTGASRPPTVAAGAAPTDREGSELLETNAEARTPKPAGPAEAAFCSRRP